MAGGRPKGSGGLTRQAMLKALTLRLGDDFDPVAIMAHHANELHIAADKSRKSHDREIAIAAMEKVAPYIVPKLKHMDIDISSSDGSMTPPRTIRLIAVPVDQKDAKTPQKGTQDATEGV